MNPRVSIIVPVYNEGDRIISTLDRLLHDVTTPNEILVVYDSPSDSTVPHIKDYASANPQVTPTLNSHGPGPAYAIRSGIDNATTKVVVVTTSDGSDDTTQIDALVELVEEGAAIASPSRYSRGGRQIGGPLLKSSLSRAAGLSLFWLARVGTRDATNGYKAYSKAFVDQVGIESTRGWDIALELVAKARRLRLPVAEIPTVWHERTEGKSNFKLLQWLPNYLRWYFFAFGRRMTADQLAKQRTSEADA